MKVYISGPISGVPLSETKAKFGRVANHLLESGHIPVNPVELSAWGFTWDTYMQIAASILGSREVDAICMLEGWKRSKGAVLEWTMARTLDIPIIYMDPKDEKVWGRRMRGEWK